MTRGSRLALVVGLAVGLAACADPPRPLLRVDAPADLAAVLDELVELVPTTGLEVTTGASRGDAVFHVEIIADLGGCSECYRIDARPGSSDAWVVHAADVLGAQYGVTHVLELLGFRFRHPFDTYVPAIPAPGAEATEVLGRVFAPEKTRRGLHLHTLHPTEAFYALWAPQPGLERARRLADWIIKNRGNYLQWVALDDILDPVRHAAWQRDTAEILALAHRRGLQVGLGFQLFGQASLQRGFDLVDDAALPAGPQIAARLPLLTEGLPFDTYELSFGEFFGASPDAFIATVDETYRQLIALRPQAQAGIIAAPDRIDVREVADLGPALSGFRTGVLAGLEDYATRVAAIANRTTGGDRSSDLPEKCHRCSAPTQVLRVAPPIAVKSARRTCLVDS